MFFGNSSHLHADLIFANLAYPVVGIALLVIVLLLLRRENYSRSYLVLFSVFWLYLLLVLSVIIFPIAPLPENYAFRLRTNFVPLDFGACYFRRICAANILGNILLTVPFGFGVSFIARLKAKDFIWLSPLVGLVFEMLQLILALLFRSSFRVIDINDFLLNALGVWIGYLLFRIFGWIYLFVMNKLTLRPRSIFAYIYSVVRQSQ